MLYNTNDNLCSLYTLEYNIYSNIFEGYRISGLNGYQICVIDDMWILGMGAIRVYKS